MRVIDLESWPRRAHFAKFNGFANPRWDMCTPMEVTALSAAVKERGVSFWAAIVYVLARAANDLPEFRQRIRGDRVVEHEIVHPSVTVLVGEDLFSFCYLDYQVSFPAFAGRFAASLGRAREQPTLADLPGRDDLLFMSAIPWVSFTAFTHPLPTLPADSIPRFAFGRAAPQDGGLRMPLEVDAHHALVDGIHMARYYRQVQTYLDDPGAFLDTMA